MEASLLTACRTASCQIGCRPCRHRNFITTHTHSLLVRRRAVREGADYDAAAGRADDERHAGVEALQRPSRNRGRARGSGARPCASGRPISVSVSTRFAVACNKRQSLSWAQCPCRVCQQICCMGRQGTRLRMLDMRLWSCRRKASSSKTPSRSGSPMTAAWEHG